MNSKTKAKYDPLRKNRSIKQRVFENFQYGEHLTKQGHLIQYSD